jgi:hypothetical protein
LQRTDVSDPAYFHKVVDLYAQSRGGERLSAYRTAFAIKLMREDLLAKYLPRELACERALQTINDGIQLFI